jgi:hypothetical protein
MADGTEDIGEKKKLLGTTEMNSPMQTAPIEQTSSRFTGVFTLQSQVDADRLAHAVKSLVDQGVEVFDLIQQSRGGELHRHLATVAAVSPSFLELTLDREERARAQAVIDALRTTERELSPLLTTST